MTNQASEGYKKMFGDPQALTEGQQEILDAMNALPGLSRWDRKMLDCPPIATHNQAGQLLPREQRWDPLTGSYYGDPEPPTTSDGNQK